MGVKEHLNLFAHQFDPILINEISEVATLRTFKKDDIIIDVAQTLEYIPLLVQGDIKVMRQDENDHEILLYILESGDTCAMSLTCCMSKSKSKIRAIADTEVTVVMIPLKYMQLWFHNNESWRNFIILSYQIRFDEMISTIDTLAFLKMDERLLKYLKEKAVLNDSKVIKTTHQEIAKDLNTSRVVISRLLKQLENNEIITLGRNKVTLL